MLICVGIKPPFMYSPGLTCQIVLFRQHKKLWFSLHVQLSSSKMMSPVSLSVFLPALLPLSVCPLFSVCTPHTVMKDMFLSLIRHCAEIYEKTHARGETSNKRNNNADSIHLSFWYSMGRGIVSNTVLYNHCHPLMIMNKIISNQISAKKGDLVQMCVYQGRVFIHMCVCLCVHTFIT